MKILHLSRGYADYLAGTLSAVPPEFEVWCVLSGADRAIAQFFRPNVRLVDMDIPRARSLKNLVLLIKLCWLIAKLRPHAIHMQSGLVWELVPAALFFWVPKIVTVHDVDSHPTNTFLVRTPMLFQRLAIRMSKAVVVHGECLSASAEAKYRLSKNGTRVAVMPHGLITKYGVRGARRSSTKNVLFFGTVDKYKGADLLVIGMNSVYRQHPDARLRVAGKNVCGVDLLSLIDAPYAEKTEIIERYISDQEVAELFDWADVIVLPYIEASQSGVLNVALSFALPAIVANVGALPEAICNGQSGVIVEPASSEAIARALCSVMENPSVLLDFSRFIEQTRQKLHGRDRQSEVLESLYRSVRRS